MKSEVNIKRIDFKWRYKHFVVCNCRKRYRQDIAITPAVWMSGIQNGLCSIYRYPEWALCSDFYIRFTWWVWELAIVWEKKNYNYSDNTPPLTTEHLPLGEEG